MQLIRRYLFSFLSLALSVLVFWGWWYSSKVWNVVNAETPFGIFRMQSESSLFGVGAQFMRHDHRWAIHTSPDEITGDVMKFLPIPPDFKLGGGLIFLSLPYWQLALALLMITGLVFYIERIRVALKQRRLN